MSGEAGFRRQATMSVFDKMRKMMEADTKCAYSKVKCSKCRFRSNCDILEKYLKGDRIKAVLLEVVKAPREGETEENNSLE